MDHRAFVALVRYWLMAIRRAHRTLWRIAVTAPTRDLLSFYLLNRYRTRQLRSAVELIMIH